MGRRAPASAGANGEPCTPSGQASGTNDRAGRSAAAKASVSADSAAPIGIGAIRGPGASAPRAVASTISPIGVMPAMGSVANEPSAYDTAPIILPSTYTGLPLMPAMTPVLARGPPLSLAMIRSRCGPTFERTTPRMCASNSSIVVPWKTVRPTPAMPGCTSSIGM